MNSGPPPSLSADHSPRWRGQLGLAALRVGKNAAARLAAQVVARLLSLVLVALVARHEGAASLGRYVLVVTVAGIAGAVSDVGLNMFVTREAAHVAGAQDQREFLGRVLPLKALLSLGGFVSLIAVAALVPFPQATKRLIPLGGLVLLPDALLGAMGALVNARQRMEVSGALNLAARLAAVAGSFLALILGYGVAGVLGCTAGASLLGVLPYLVVLRHWGLLSRWRWDPPAWRAYLAESYPFALTSIIAMAYARLDLVLLGLWRGDVAAGWYGAAYKLWEAVGLLPASLLDAMFPEMSRLSGSREGMQRLRHLFRTAGRAMLVGGLLLGVGGALGARVLVPLIYGPGGSHAPTVLAFRVLVWAIPAMFLYLLSGHTLYAVGRQRRVTASMLVIGLANVGLNVVAIPRWGYLGAAAVALLSGWLLCATLYPQASQALNSKSRTQNLKSET